MILSVILDHFEPYFCRYFSCAFYGDSQLLSTAYALNKKEAKTKAAAEALKYLLLTDSVRNSSVCTVMPWLHVK